jgi:hypothetical protein
MTWIYNNKVASIPKGYRFILLTMIDILKEEATFADEEGLCTQTMMTCYFLYKRSC